MENVAASGYRKIKRSSAPEQREQIPYIYKTVGQGSPSVNPSEVVECSSQLPAILPLPLDSEIIRLLLSSGQSFISGFSQDSRASLDFEYRSIYTFGSLDLTFRKRNKAMIDLIGIEPNPGPKKVKTVYVVQNSAQAKKKKKKSGKQNPQGGSRRNMNSVGAGNMLTSAPASFGFVAPKSYFRMGTNVQRLADQDARSGVRCTGCALFGSNINVYTASGGSANLNGGFSYASGTANVGYAFISAASVDPRLTALAQTFQYNAPRRLLVRYVPNVATSTSGTLFLGITKDPLAAQTDFAAIGAASPGDGTTQGILDYDPSVMSTIWQPAMMEYVHTGVKLWETFDNSTEPVIDRIPAAFVCAVGSAVTGATSTLFGYLWIEYEWDFYVPGAPLGSN
jgi:hypothetical protein